MEVLIAEDEDISRMWLESVVTSWGYSVISVSNGLDAWNILQRQNAPQVAIIDWQMPGMDGIEICQKLKSEPIRHFCYSIMLSSKSTSGDLIEAFQAGADEFVQKPFNPEELRVRLRAGARIVELQQQLMERASRDGLTGIFNRWMLMEMAQREIERCKRDDAPLSVLILDLDNFKSINDNYGHPCGDAVIVEAANRIKEIIRTVDVLGRYGGEEFLLVLPQCTLKTASNVAERIRKDIARSPIIHAEHALTITISIGASCASHSADMILSQLIKQADDALYHAKKNGRNRVEKFLV